MAACQQPTLEHAQDLAVVLLTPQDQLPMAYLNRPAMLPLKFISQSGASSCVAVHVEVGQRVGHHKVVATRQAA
jgi:hypothetical protein